MSESERAQPGDGPAPSPTAPSPMGEPGSADPGLAPTVDTRPGPGGPAPVSAGLVDRSSTTGHRSRGRVVTVLVAVVVVLAAAVGSYVVLGTGTQAGFTSADAANAALFAAARAARSFHYSGTESGSIGGQPLTETQTGDAGWNEGIQYTTSDAGSSEVIVVGSLAYLKPDLLTLENSFGLAAPQATPYVNRWIEFTRADKPFNSVAGDVTTQTTWISPSTSPFAGEPHQTRTVSAPAVVGGRSVQTVSYTVSGPSKVTGERLSGTEDITFSAKAPHLPLTDAGRTSGTIGGTPATSNGRTDLSHWGETVHVTAPAGAIPFSSLPPPPTTA